MARQVTQFDLLISCPSNVIQELEIINETVNNFNRMYGSANNASIVTKHWSKDSYPESGDHPQKLLNKQFALDCDAAVAVFWTKFGTPTDEYGSGTEEEIEELMKSGKQVFLYFSDCLANPSSIDHGQYEKVLAFREKYKGYYGTYSCLDDFKKSFLNHLSLYFVKLLSDCDTTTNKTISKLSVKGVANGKLSDQPVIFRRDYSCSQFIQGIRDSIAEIYDRIKSTALPLKVIESKSSISQEITPLSNELALKFGEVALMWQNQLKNIGSIFPSSNVIINDDIKEVINNHAKDNYIDLNKDEFFYVGDLAKQQQLLGGVLYGTGPSYQLVGSDDEKNKYELIRQLRWKIVEYLQYSEYFKAIDNKFYLELVLSNFGTNFDEDVDIKVFVKKGILCTKDKLPFPGNDILKIANKVFDAMFKSKKTVYIDDYYRYPTLPVKTYVPSFGLGGRSEEDKVENNKSEYNNTLDATFCYDYFRDDDYDIICYNQKYIKQNTSVFFPSILVFNEVPNKIVYEISSKHYPEIIKGELLVNC